MTDNRSLIQCIERHVSRYINVTIILTEYDFYLIYIYVLFFCLDFIFCRDMVI